MTSNTFAVNSVVNYPHNIRTEDLHRILHNPREFKMDIPLPTHSDNFLEGLSVVIDIRNGFAYTIF